MARGGDVKLAKIKGGEKLEKRLAEIASQLGKPGTLSVGFLEGSTYPDGTSVPMVAAIQNFGAPKVGIPPRPYFDQFIAKNSKAWPKSLATLIKVTNYNTEKTLNIMGMALKGQLQESIADLTAPPLSPVTLMLRKMRSEDQSLVVTASTVAEARRRVKAGETTAGVSDKPLVYSKHLLHSVDYEVKTK